MYIVDKNQNRLYPYLLTSDGLVKGSLQATDEAPHVAEVPINNPVLYISTLNQAAITSKTAYVTCTYKIVNSHGFGATLFEQPGRIRGRGNSTWTMPKKPWKVKLDTASEIMGMPKSKDWALLANYIDPSKIRGSLAFEISNRTEGLPWAPRSCHVEVYVNDTYQGLYQLIESVEVATSRVAIDELKTSHVSGRDLTGGYILEVDTRLEENDEIGWRTRLGVPIIFDTPDGTIAEQFAYAKDFTQACEDALFSNTFTEGGWKLLLDETSWADWYLLNELLANNDSGFGASVKMTKPRNPATGSPSKLHLGPAWDFDASGGITFFIPHPANAWWTRIGATWIARMIEDPSFRDTLKRRWASLRSQLLAEDNSIFEWIDRQQDMLGGAIQRDGALWGNGTAPAIDLWLRTRIDWLTLQLNRSFGQSGAPSVPTGFHAQTVGATMITFSWDDSGADQGMGVIGYRIRQAGVIVAMTAYPYGSLTTSTVQGLSPATLYSFTLECRNPEGVWSTATASLNVTTSL